MLSEKYKCDQPGKTEFLVAPLDNGHFITGACSTGGCLARLASLGYPQSLLKGQLIIRYLTEFDEALVKKLIEKITVFADHFTVKFKSGITIYIEA